jgi:hypothetical protein
MPHDMKNRFHRGIQQPVFAKKSARSPSRSDGRSAQGPVRRRGDAAGKRAKGLVAPGGRHGACVGANRVFRGYCADALPCRGTHRGGSSGGPGRKERWRTICQLSHSVRPAQRIARRGARCSDRLVARRRDHRPLSACAANDRRSGRRAHPLYDARNSRTPLPIRRRSNVRKVWPSAYPTCSAMRSTVSLVVLSRWTARSIRRS